MAASISDFTAVCASEGAERRTQSLPFNQRPSLTRATIMEMPGAAEIGCANGSLMEERGAAFGPTEADGEALPGRGETRAC